MSTEARIVHTSIFNEENGTEIARQLHQDQLLTRMLGIIPERDDDFRDMSKVLDLACGPGAEWALHIAHTCPKVEVIGVDRSPLILRHARSKGHVQGLENAIFQEMDILAPFEFPDAVFDLVNARFLQSILPTHAAWLEVIREAFRVLRPGGILRLTEAELPVTNSPALQQLTSLFTCALQREGRTYSQASHIAGIASLLEHLFHQVGFGTPQQKMHAIDFSVGSDVYGAMRQNIMVGVAMVKPFLMRTQVIAQGDSLLSQQEFHTLVERAASEMLENSFTGNWRIITTWGRKPLTSGSLNRHEQSIQQIVREDTVYA